MAGGTWSTQNKIRPGVYIRFASVGNDALAVGTRGTAAICEPMSWGPMATVTELTAEDDFSTVCGYPRGTKGALFLDQIFLGTDRTAPPSRVLVYRPTASGSAIAGAEIGEMTVTALYPGVRGNDISVVVEAEETGGTFAVSTIVDGAAVDTQRGILQIADLAANDWVKFSGSGTLTANAGVSLTGGANGTVETAAYAAFLQNIESYKFDVLIYDGTDQSVISSMIAFVKRLSEDNGQYCQLAAANVAAPNSPYVINNISGVTLTDGTKLTAGQVCWWLGGAEAGASYTQSLTYAGYPGAAAADMMTNSQYEKAILSGQIALSSDNGRVKIEDDINTLTTLTDEPESFKYNKTIRLISQIANDIYAQFSQSFIGLVSNNESGRERFKAAIVGYMLELQSEEAIQNFVPDDVEVLPGESLTAILVNAAIQPVGSVEKIYITVTVS